jgi:hypothetical protein
MIERSIRAVSAAVAVALLAAGTMALVGCTETDLIRSETTSTSVAIQPSTAGGSEFETGTAGISQIIIRPVDPEVAAAVGRTGSFGLLDRGFTFDLYSGVVEVAGNPLYPGAYEVTTVVFRPPSLVNADPAAPGDPVPCIDKIADIPGSASGFVRGEYNIDFTNLATPPVVVVERGDMSGIVVAIDTDLLLDVYLSLFTCRDSGTLRCGFNGPLPPCLSAFDLDLEFAELAAPAFSFP